MAKKYQFMNQNQRNEWNQKTKEIEDRLTGKKKEDEEYMTYNEGLKQCLPENQRKYADGKCYMFLCQMLKKFLEENNMEENRLALKIAKENFEDYCKTEEKKND